MLNDEYPLITVKYKIYQDINQLGLDNKNSKYVVLKIGEEMSLQTDFCVQSDKDF